MKPEQIERFIKTQKKQLQLDDWKFYLEIALSDVDYLGCINFAPGRKEAILTIRQTLPETDTIAGVVRHELLHAIMRPISLLVDQWKAMLKEEDAKLYETQMDEAEDQVVAHLTHILP